MTARIPLSFALPLALLLIATAPAPAEAATTCFYDGVTSRLLVTMNAGRDRAFLRVGAGNEIEVLDKVFDQADCSGIFGDPLVTNTDEVLIDDNSGGSTSVQVFEPSDFFNAGQEIDFDVDLGPGKRDELGLNDGPGGFGSWRYGAEGINIYANEAVNDVDYQLTGVERNRATGGPDFDLISGAGGEGTGAASPGRLILSGGFGDDDLTGGRGRDLFQAADFGADVIRGGKGVDAVDYCCSFGEGPLPVRVTVGTGADDGGPGDESQTMPGRFDNVHADIEVVRGTIADDTLIGDGGRNVLVGGIGRDRLLGRRGRDLLRARDFVKDRRLDCGPGRDRIRRDPFDPEPTSC